jgi:hypothetical protein
MSNRPSRLDDDGRGGRHGNEGFHGLEPGELGALQEEVVQLMGEDAAKGLNAIERLDRGWLTNRLRGSLHLTFSQLFSVLNILDIDGWDFFGGALPPRRKRGATKDSTFKKAKTHFWDNLETEEER